MQKFSSLLLVVGLSGWVACGAACGSAAGTRANESAGGDAAPPAIDAGSPVVVDGGMPTPDVNLGDDAPSCGWASYSDGLSGAAIVDVLFDTRNQPPVAYASGGSSFYISGDGGHTWHTQGTFAGGSIGLLAAPGNDPEEFLAASTAGVIRSTDGGVTWSVLSLDGQAVSSIAVAPGQPLRVYVGVRGSGVLRSDDGGSTWSAVNQGYPYVDTVAIDVAQDNPDEVVAVGQNLNAQGGTSGDAALVRTTSGGQSWQTVVGSDGNAWNVRRCAADPSVLYAATNTGVARSADRGATWTLLPLGSAVVEDVEISPSDCNDVYAMASTEGPRHSTDGGQTFGPLLTQGLDLIEPGTFPGRMAVDPTRKGGVVLGSHAGIWYSTDGATWNLSQGLLGISVSALAVSPLDPTRVWLSSWGSGVWERPSAGVEWQRLSTTALPVDYTFTVAPDPYTPNRVLVGANSALYQSKDGMTFAMDPVQQNERAVAYDPTNPSIVYVGTQLAGIYKSTDGGTTWTASNTGIAPWEEQLGSPVIDVSQIMVDPASPQTIYVGTNGRGVFKSTDGAQSWKSVLAPMKAVGCLLAAQATAGGASTIYACVQGAGVQTSADGVTWSDLSKGLPTQDVGGLVFDAASGFLYATAGADVFVKDASPAWAGLDAVCMVGTGAAHPVIVSRASGRSLVVAAAGGVYAHPL